MTIFLLCASLYTEARHTITVPEAETDDPTPPGARKEQSNAELGGFLTQSNKHKRIKEKEIKKCRKFVS